MNRDVQVGIFDAIATLRSMRRLKEEIVDEGKIRVVLDAATMAPSSQDTQPWEFLVLRDSNTKKRLGELVERGYRMYLQLRMGELHPKLDRALNHLYTHLADVPVLILLCLNEERAYRRLRPDWRRSPWRGVVELATYGSVFPAMQNLILAARGLGLGSWISVFHYFLVGEVKDLLKIPQHIQPLILIGIGYPHGNFSRPKRIPAERFTHYDHW